MEQRTLKNVNNCLNTNIYSYLETSGGQSSNLYSNVAHFLTPVLIRHLWQLKTVVWAEFSTLNERLKHKKSSTCCRTTQGAKASTTTVIVSSILGDTTLST